MLIWLNNMTQDEKWQSKWQAALDFITTNSVTLPSLTAQKEKPEIGYGTQRN